MKMTEIDNFTKHYLIAALWSSTDEEGEPLDSKYELSDFAPSALKQASDECRDFRNNKMVMPLLEQAYDSDFYQRLQYHPDCGGKLDSGAGHDFWLSRNGHGAGFFDRGSQPFWRGLQNCAKIWGSCDIYEGDDGKLYFA